MRILIFGFKFWVLMLTHHPSFYWAPISFQAWVWGVVTKWRGNKVCFPLNVLQHQGTKGTLEPCIQMGDTIKTSHQPGAGRAHIMDILWGGMAIMFLYMCKVYPCDFHMLISLSCFPILFRSRHGFVIFILGCSCLKFA